MGTIDIVDVLRKHAAWLAGKADGERAYLCGATLPDGTVHA